MFRAFRETKRAGIYNDILLIQNVVLDLDFSAMIIQISLIMAEAYTVKFSNFNREYRSAKISKMEKPS